MGFLTRLAEAVKTVFQGEPLREAAGTTIDDDEDSWTRLSGDNSRDLSPLSQSRMRDAALYLWDSNMLANRIVELQLAYLLADGVELRAKDPEHQATLDAFWRDPINSLDIKLPKKARELALFGEQCWPVFVNEHSGHVRLGYLDPANIETVVLDPDNAEQPIGIVTRRDKKGNARRYRIIINGPEDVFTARTQGIRQTFDDGECFFFTINDLSLSRRGRSDLRAPADWVDAYDQFLFGELECYNFLRAFAWDVELTGVNQEAVDARAKKITAPKPGNVLVHNESEKWTAISPDVKAGDTAEGARLFRNHALGGATIPEHWFGGGGDVNRAAASEMGEPTFKVFSMRQRVLKHILECMGTYALRQRHIAERGGEPDWQDEALQCEAVFPEMTTRDTTKYAAALAQVVTAVAMAVQRGHLTDETAIKIIAAVAAKLGVEIDPKDELEKANTAAEKRAEADTFPPAANPDDPAGAAA